MPKHLKPLHLKPLVIIPGLATVVFAFAEAAAAVPFVTDRRGGM